MVESHCLSLRMLYRDCARPAPPKVEKPRSEVSLMAVYIYRQLGKSDCLGCAVLLCLVVCLNLLASFFISHKTCTCDHFDMLIHTAEGVHAGRDAGVASGHVVCLHPQPHLPVLPGTLCCHHRLLLLHAPRWVWGRVPGGRFPAEGSHVVCQHGNPQLRKSIQELFVFLCNSSMYNVHVRVYTCTVHVRIRNASTCTCTCLLEVLLILSPHLLPLPPLLPLPSLRHSTGRWSLATWERARLTQFTLPWDTRQPQPSRQTANRGPTIQTPSSCAGKFLLHQNFYFFPHKHIHIHCIYTCIDLNIYVHVPPYCSFFPIPSAHSTGRCCQVRGENLLEWNTFRLASPLKNGDVVGCGWVREEEGAKGRLYFTVNGHLMENGFSDVPPEMVPFLHIQKKVRNR